MRGNARGAARGITKGVGKARGWAQNRIFRWGVGLPLLAASLTLWINKAGLPSGRTSYFVEPNFLSDLASEIGNPVWDIVNFSLILGMITAVAYTIFDTGFSVTKKFGSFRKFTGMLGVTYLLMFTVYPQLAEYNTVRQADDADYGNSVGGLNVTENAPFFSGLFDSFLDGLDNLGNLDMDMNIANVSLPDGLPGETPGNFLYKYTVYDSYSDSFEFELSNTGEAPMTLTDADTGPSGGNPVALDMQFAVPLATSTLYLTELLTNWNSIHGDFIGDESEWEDGGDGSTIMKSNPPYLYRDVAEHPHVEITFNEFLAFGAINYRTWHIKDNMTYFGDNCLNVADYDDFSSGAEQNYMDLFLQIPDTDYRTSASGPLDETYTVVVEAHNMVDPVTNPTWADTTSAYTLSVAIMNYLRQIAAEKGVLSSDTITDPRENPDGVDYALTAFENDPSVTSFITAQVMMNRILGIPTRPVFGFSMGDNVTLDDGSPAKALLVKHLFMWVEILLPLDDGLGGTVLRWVPFQLFPDANSLLETGDLVFGVNAIGGTLEIEAEITNGEDPPLGVTLPPSLEEVSLISVGNAVEMDVDVTSDGQPAVGAIIDFRLLDEDDMVSAQTMIEGTPDISALTQLGTSMTEATTDALGNIVQSFTYESINDTISAETGAGVQNVILDPLAPETHAYAFLLISGTSYDLSVFGYLDDRNVTVSIDVLHRETVPYQDPLNPGTLPVHPSLWDDVFSGTVTVTRDVGEETEPAGLVPYKIYVMTRTTVNNLIVAGDISALSGETPAVEGTTLADGTDAFLLTMSQTVATHNETLYGVVATSAEFYTPLEDVAWIALKHDIETTVDLTSSSELAYYQNATGYFANVTIDVTLFAWRYPSDVPERGLNATVPSTDMTLYYLPDSSWVPGSTTLHGDAVDTGLSFSVTGGTFSGTLAFAVDDVVEDTDYRFCIAYRDSDSHATVLNASGVWFIVSDGPYQPPGPLVNEATISLEFENLAMQIDCDAPTVSSQDDCSTAVAMMLTSVAVLFVCYVTVAMKQRRGRTSGNADHKGLVAILRRRCS